MKILYILDFFHPQVGGVITVFYNLASEMVRRGNSVTVLTTHAGGTKSFERINGINVYRVGTNRESFMVKGFLKLLKMGERFDLIHTSTYSAMLPSFAYSFLRRHPLVLSVHENWSLREYIEFYKAKGPFYYLGEKILFSLPFDIYVSPSRHTKRDLERLGIRSEKIRVVPHGIDTQTFSPAMKKFRREFRRKHMLEDKIIGTFVGKALTFKGIDYLIPAIERISKKHGNIKFILLLSKLHLSSYEKLIKLIQNNEHLRRSIIIAEPTHDKNFVAKMIGASDFLIMPSLSEGFGLVAAEAASIGIPVIATKDTSLTEVLEDGRNAIFIRPRNVGDICGAVERLATDKKLRGRLSRGKKFKNWREVAGEYVKVYQDAIRKHKEAGK